MVILRNDSPSLDTHFLYIVLQSRLVQTQIERLAFGSAQPQLTVTGISKFRILVPPLPEQRAVAGTLSDVDALLRALDQLIAKKRGLKQAAMQQLLTGLQRLPTSFPLEWGATRLAKIVSLIPSGIYGEEKPRAGLLPSPVATTAHIDEDDSWNNKQMSVRYFSPEQIREYSPLEGDLIVVKSSGSAEKIQSGKIGFVDKERAGKFYLAISLCSCGQSIFCQDLSTTIYVLTMSRSYCQCWLRLQPIQTFGLINLEFRDPIPSADEQCAIAVVLSDMDAEILAALEQKRDKTRALKQGMMQELLTGRTRLI